MKVFPRKLQKDLGMDDKLLAALVAGIISFVGIVINLYITHVNRKEAIKQLKLASGLKNNESTLTAFTRFCKEIEQLRIICCQLIARINQLTGSDSLIERDYLKDNEYIGVSELKNTFNSQFNLFFEAWAEVKIELPEHLKEMISIFIHSSKNRQACIHLRLRNYLILIEENSNNIDQLLDSSSLISQLNNLIKELENLYEICSSKRNSIVADLLVKK